VRDRPKVRISPQPWKVFTKQKGRRCVVPAFSDRALIVLAAPVIAMLRQLTLRNPVSCLTLH
jgi:hypothetical protein